MGLRRLGYLPLLLGLSLLGCAGIGSRATLDPPAERGAHGRIDSVPFFAQAEHQCGPAALAMALSWSGVAVKPEELLATVYSPARQGSLQYALIAAARRHGRLAYPITGIDPLLTETAAGHPVIVLQNLGLSWFPRWHYAVVVGYDLPAREIILHTGKTPYQPLPLRTFKNTWARSGYWGLLVLPPDALPAEAEEEAHLAAVLGLEKAGQWDAAATGYQTVLRRWPGNLTARRCIPAPARRSITWRRFYGSRGEPTRRWRRQRGRSLWAGRFKICTGKPWRRSRPHIGKNRGPIRGAGSSPVRSLLRVEEFRAKWSPTGNKQSRGDAKKWGGKTAAPRKDWSLSDIRNRTSCSCRALS
jgi:hypothetical protein